MVVITDLFRAVYKIDPQPFFSPCQDIVVLQEFYGGIVNPIPAISIKQDTFK